MAKVRVVVMCSNSSGIPDVFKAEIEATAHEQNQGAHLLWAVGAALEQGYESPCVTIERTDDAARHLSNDLQCWLGGASPSKDKVVVLDGWMITASESGDDAISVIRDGAPGKIDIAATDEGFTVSIQSDDIPRNTTATVSATYQELESE